MPGQRELDRQPEATWSGVIFRRKMSIISATSSASCGSRVSSALSLAIGASAQAGRAAADVTSGVRWASCSSSAFAAGSDEAGFWPVMSNPSTITCGCQSVALE